MSERYPGGIISKTAPVPTGPYENGTAPGVWTLDQQAAYAKQGIWPLAGNVPNYIEDVFSTWLYTGNGSTQTITNGIDLAGEGGLVWLKRRDGVAYHNLIDTARGAGNYLFSNTTDANIYSPGYDLTAFNSNGFSLGPNGYGGNANGASLASWTFRKQPKFFDVVTYTGNGTAGRTVAHNLGSVPGCIIIKNLTTSGTTWCVYHKDISGYIQLQSTSAASATTVVSNVTSTSFDVAQYQFVNGDTESLVAYLFAHNAGGFGLTGTDNVISCGSVVGASQVEVNLGYEPQWILVKNASAAQDWWVVDNMRGLPVQATDTSYNASALRPNLSDAETTGFSIAPSATGFKANVLTTGQTYIYIAIRRGPMKVPTDGTEVFVPVTSSATGSVLTSNFPVDMGLIAGRGVYERGINDRLRGFANTDPGASPWLVTQSTAAETLNSNNPSLYNANNTSIQTGAYFGSASAVSYLFGRAPGFFDEVCYTGNGSTQTITHNLGVAPELIIAKNRGQAGNNWPVLFNFTSTTLGYGFLNTTTAENNQTYAYVAALASAPTATTFSLVNSSSMNASGYGIVAYLFATCPGVSKVGLYTGTATTQQIDCGFTSGSRFVMIKRADGAGDWYVWDSARGIVAGNDPYLLFNNVAAEVTGTDYVDTYSAGFEITSTAPAAINASGGTYIFLAIA